MKQNKPRNNKLVGYIILGIIIYIFAKTAFNNGEYNINIFNDSTFHIICTSDNKDIGESLAKYASKNDYDITIDYFDTFDAIDELNSGAEYDAIIMSNSIWLSMLDSSKVKTSNLRSTSISPVIFGIKKSKAESLGFVNKDIYTKDILNKVKSGELSFSMGNPLATNSGVSAYLEILLNLAGNPEVLNSEHLNDKVLISELKEFFSGIKRTSGDENFLETSFINGDYDAAFTYESSIININKQLEKEGKEILYAIYPVDGVAISDSPFVYIDNKNQDKKDTFEKLQAYLLSSDGQKELLQSGRRTWYGGVNNNAPKDIFNPSWGINTTKYITPVKYPSISVINEALALYQMELKKPVHVVFCLDYSGSMYGDGFDELSEAMRQVLIGTENNIRFTDRDKIDVIAFSSNIIDIWSSSSGLSREDIYDYIESTPVDGATALYLAATKGLEILNKENSSEYIPSIILMTDGQANVGTMSSLRSYYKSIKKDIPIYSITFGNADEDELEEIAELTNGKVFDGKGNLAKAFKKVRGYN